jgi:hypothetical protein
MGTKQSIGYHYKIIHDPDETWGRNSCFRFCEIVTLLKDGYLTEGTKFDVRGRIYVVVNIRGNQTLKRIGGC